ncbi:hypothetical protein KUTeg_012695 [Tegillarca granosa]|uniref:ATP-dependent DNA helicase n=1 Tax=Tegillarca granosa TaxID=220873 RepID=A0ABQ9F5J0_TEGGR|nr:hypothetical protein KUTeg_012695 [Tegillarca granosa]
MDNKLILDQAIKGHSVIILGQSGTGKSTLSKQIAKEISVKGRNVACTATTGIASLNIGGRTIHSWCGIGDGRYSNGCCKYNIDEVKQQGVAESHYTSPNHELSDFSEDELNEIDFLLSSDADLMAIGETGNETEKNIEAEVEKVIDVTEISVLFCGEKTAPRDQVISLHYQNLICNKLEKVEKFVNNLFASLTDIFKKTCGDVSSATPDPKVWNLFHTELYNFSISSNYISLVQSLFENAPSELDYEVCSVIFDKVKSIVLSKQSQHLMVSKENKSKTVSVLISESGLGKLRYIFGRCIAKSRYSHMKIAKQNLYNPKNRESVAKSFLKVKMLDFLTTSYSDLENNSNFMGTLHETKRKQNLTEGLTNITDSAFLYAKELEEKRNCIQTVHNFHVYGSDFLKYCHSVLLDNSVLFNKWRNLFSKFEILDKYLFTSVKNAENSLQELYADVILRFCRIADNQFRKDILHQVGKTKSERLRKRVDSKSTSKSELNMKFIYEDKSDEKHSTHLKLKSKIFDDGKLCFNKFAKTDLSKLCKAYEIQFASRDSVDTLKEKLCAVIPERDKITFAVHLKKVSVIHEPVQESTSQSTELGEPGPSSDLGEPQPGPSTSTEAPSVGDPVSISASQTKSKLKKRKSVFSKTSRNKKKGKSTRENEDKTICPICKNEYLQHEEWLACDICDTWYHRNCTTISGNEWNNIGETDWYCAECLK